MTGGARLAGLVAFSIGLAACGSGPKLSNLRCRNAAKCQHPEDPFRLLLAVDFDDPTGTLDKGALDLRVSGNTQNSVSIRDLFTLQNLAAGATHGTLDIDDEVVLDRVQQNQQFTVSLLATNGAGQGSNEPKLTFNLHLGSSP